MIVLNQKKKKESERTVAFVGRLQIGESRCIDSIVVLQRFNFIIFGITENTGEDTEIPAPIHPQLPIPHLLSHYSSSSSPFFLFEIDRRDSVRPGLLIVLRCDMRTPGF